MYRLHNVCLSPLEIHSELLLDTRQYNPRAYTYGFLGCKTSLASLDIQDAGTKRFRRNHDLCLLSGPYSEYLKKKKKRKLEHLTRRQCFNFSVFFPQRPLNTTVWFTTLTRVGPLFHFSENRVLSFFSKTVRALMD